MTAPFSTTINGGCRAGFCRTATDIVAGFPVRQIIIWKRKGGFNFNPGYFLPTYEVIYLIAKPKFRLPPKRQAAKATWEFMQETRNLHPAAVPGPPHRPHHPSAAAKLILDPFIGSGTTAISALNFRPQLLGLELSPDYCARRASGSPTTGRAAAPQ